MDEGTGGKKPWMFVFKGEGPNATFVEQCTSLNYGKDMYID